MWDIPFSELQLRRRVGQGAFGAVRALRLLRCAAGLQGQARTRTAVLCPACSARSS